MEFTMLLLVLVVGLALVGAAAQTWGVDTRDPYPDDHTR